MEGGNVFANAFERVRGAQMPPSVLFAVRSEREKLMASFGPRYVRIQYICVRVSSRWHAQSREEILTLRLVPLDGARRCWRLAESVLLRGQRIFDDYVNDRPFVLVRDRIVTSMADGDQQTVLRDTRSQ